MLIFSIKLSSTYVMILLYKRIYLDFHIIENILLN